MHPRRLRPPLAAMLTAIALPAIVTSTGIAVEPAGTIGLTAEGRRYVAEALDAMNMTVEDPGFHKDHAEPRLVLPVARQALQHPMSLVDMAANVIEKSLAGTVDEAWRGIREWMSAEEPPPLTPPPSPVAPVFPASVPEALRPALAGFYLGACTAQAEWDAALAALSMEDKQRLAAAQFGSLLNLEDDPAALAAVAADGVPEFLLRQVVAEGRELDAHPYTTAFLDRVARLDRPRLLQAGRILVRAASELSEQTQGVVSWPDQPVRVNTGIGPIWIGTLAADVYTESALAILDPGGDDTYTGQAGVGNGLVSNGLAVVVDRAGNDRYGSTRLCGPGTGLFGVSVLLDAQGNDVHDTAYVGQGAGLFGVGWLADGAGDDIYRARLAAQGAGVAGIGYLRDAAGNDVYHAGLQAQGFAGVQGLGWLIDTAGNDVYYAGGREPDHERHDDRYLSLAQGFSIGMRPEGAGGIGLLVDLAGNDVYSADIFGQGASYWYAIGMLLDLSGHDTYSVYHYGQGSGIHLSSGLLYDGTGNDRYSGGILAQGNAHDFGVGILLDERGNDLYTAHQFAQGQAINNSFALLYDRSGDDVYHATRAQESQGSGNFNPDRGYGSLSVLLDMAGRDHFSGGAENNSILLHPDDGVVLDVEAAPKPGEASLAEAAPPSFDPPTASLDTLMSHASRYGNTEQRRRDKAAARKEFMNRGVPAFRYLVERAYMENIYFYLYARDMVAKLPGEEAADALVDLLADPREDTRKIAAFLLGFFHTPRHAPRLRALLDDEGCGGAACRTLGKWADTEAVPGIVRQLSDAKERRRIQAAVALGEIGDARAIPSLVTALSDPVFTVRNAAAQALALLPAEPVGTALLAALPEMTPVARRQGVRTLGRLAYAPATATLIGFLTAPEAGLRGDAAYALRQIGMPEARQAVESLMQTEQSPFVQNRMEADTTAGAEGR